MERKEITERGGRMRDVQEIKNEIREYMDKRQRLESNLVGVNRYIDVLKKELCLINQIKEMED